MWVKICGITNEEDALLATALGADAIGFVFAPSTRQIAPGLARDIAQRLPPDMLTIGVFRNDAAQRVVGMCTTAGLRGAQLHGQETPADTRFVRGHLPVVIKAFAAGDPGLDTADSYVADAIMVDSPIPGSGEVFDWSLAEGAPLHRRVILAGGLTPENVAEAARRVRPYALDVSSGVESAPGKKDTSKVRAFIKAAKGATARIPRWSGYLG